MPKNAEFDHLVSIRKHLLKLIGQLGAGAFVDSKQLGSPHQHDPGDPGAGLALHGRHIEAELIQLELLVFGSGLAMAAELVAHRQDLVGVAPPKRCAIPPVVIEPRAHLQGYCEHDQGGKDGYERSQALAHGWGASPRTENR